MSLLLEKKAQELFARYQQAELSGDNDTAAALENQLNDGGWKVTVTDKGAMTIVKDRDGIFSSWGDKDTTDIDFYIPKDTPTTPYSGTTNTGKKVWLYVGIGVGILIITLVTILVIKRIKAKKNGTVKRV